LASHRAAYFSDPGSVRDLAHPTPGTEPPHLDPEPSPAARSEQLENRGPACAAPPPALCNWRAISDDYSGDVVWECEVEVGSTGPTFNPYVRRAPRPTFDNSKSEQHTSLLDREVWTRVETPRNVAMLGQYPRGVGYRNENPAAEAPDRLLVVPRMPAPLPPDGMTDRVGIRFPSTCATLVRSMSTFCSSCGSPFEATPLLLAGAWKLQFLRLTRSTQVVRQHQLVSGSLETRSRVRGKRVTASVPDDADSHRSASKTPSRNPVDRTFDLVNGASTHGNISDHPLAPSSASFQPRHGNDSPQISQFISFYVHRPRIAFLYLSPSVRQAVPASMRSQHSTAKAKVPPQYLLSSKDGCTTENAACYCCMPRGRRARPSHPPSTPCLPLPPGVRNAKAPTPLPET